MRVALHHLDVEAGVNERAWDGLEGDEPTSNALEIFCNGFANEVVHSQLVHDIGGCIDGGTHSDWWGMENVFVVLFPF